MRKILKDGSGISISANSSERAAVESKSKSPPCAKNAQGLGHPHFLFHTHFLFQPHFLFHLSFRLRCNIQAMKPILLSWSSGKDSAWGLHVLRSRGEYEVVGLL